MAELRFALNERKPGSMQTPSTSGKTITLLNDTEVKNKIHQIHHGGTESKGIPDWILLTYEGKDLTKIKELGEGNGGINELVSHLKDDIVSYGLLRVVDVVDSIPTTRFAYITWIGDLVPGVTKGRIGTNKSLITEIIGHYNIEVIASQKNELSTENIMRRIQDVSGSSKREVDVIPTTPIIKGSMISKPSSTTPSSFSSSSSSSPITSNQSLTFIDIENLKQVQKNVRSNSQSNDWMLITYSNKTELSLSGTGSGGLEELKSHLENDKVFYGILRVQDSIDQSSFYRFIFINFVGNGVSPLTKGRIVSHKGSVNGFFEPFHSFLNLSDENELTSQLVQEKIQALKGSKK